MKSGNWILVTDGERARCFARNPIDSSLRELLDFVQRQQALKRRAKSDGYCAPAGRQLGSSAEIRTKQRARFAHELAEYLNAGVAQQRCRALMLVASNTLLSEIKPRLSAAAAAAKALQRYVASDLTRNRGADLQRRAERALELQNSTSF